jgi:hypothetical protein
MKLLAHREPLQRECRVKLLVFAVTVAPRSPRGELWKLEDREYPSMYWKSTRDSPNPKIITVAPSLFPNFVRTPSSHNSVTEWKAGAYVRKLTQLWGYHYVLVDQNHPT